MTKKMISGAAVCVSGSGNDGGGAEKTAADRKAEVPAGGVVSESAGVSDQLTEELKAMVPDRDYSEFTVGFCGMTLNNEYHIIVANAVQQSCKALGMKVEIQAGSQHQSVEEQLTIIENYISQGVDGIILVPAASEGLVSALQECKNADIPVINLDTKLDDATIETLGEEIPFYGTDNYKGGQLVGRDGVAELYPDGCKTAILRGGSGSDQRMTTDTTAFLDKAGGRSWKSWRSSTRTWETDKGYTAIQNAIQANPDLEVIYCEN